MLDKEIAALRAEILVFTLIIFDSTYHNLGNLKSIIIFGKTLIIFTKPAIYCRNFVFEAIDINEKNLKKMLDRFKSKTFLTE